MKMKSICNYGKILVVFFSYTLIIASAPVFACVVKNESIQNITLHDFTFTSDNAKNTATSVNMEPGKSMVFKNAASFTATYNQASQTIEDLANNSIITLSIENDTIQVARKLIELGDILGILIGIAAVATLYNK